MAFVEAHQELRDTDASVDELGFHSVNAIVEQIFQQLREEVPSDTPPILPRQESPIVAHDNHQEILLPVQETVNATQVDPAMTTLMTTIMANMEAMRLRIEGHKYNAGRHSKYRGRGRGRVRGRGGCGGRGRGCIPQQRRRGG